MSAQYLCETDLPVTSDAAWQNFEESSKGTIEVGKLADFVVLAENPFAVDPLHLKDIVIENAIVAGETVFSRKP